MTSYSLLELILVQLVFLCKLFHKFSTAFHKFFTASGLVANLDKSNVYFAGLKEEEIKNLQEMLQIPVGRFPFRYLGVPLHSRKLFITSVNHLLLKWWLELRLGQLRNSLMLVGPN